MHHYFQYLRTYLIIKRKQLLNAFSFSKSKSYIPFVILSEPRSGSTMLHTYLNSHTQIKSYGEVLRENIEANAIATETAPYIESLAFKPHATALKAIGLKLFYEYYEDARYSNSFNYVINRKDVKIIYLIRRDILKVYVSLKIAQKTNVWSSIKSAENEPRPKIAIDRNDYIQFREEHLRHRRLFVTLLKDHPLLEVAYEDLVQNPQPVLKSIQQFLGVKPKALFTLLKQQNPGSVESMITNYDEVKDIV
ncbi:sulfotransferase [Ohtaekwangia kribbensis]|jgi:LPS sulfotransferase NodH|uniref:Sulfotransferase n=1 Tax=Ohtaekwangia kribbensis TaxID=688913 RepID=A0ABW3K7D5_9BACT